MFLAQLLLLEQEKLESSSNPKTIMTIISYPLLWTVSHPTLKEGEAVDVNFL